MIFGALFGGIGRWLQQVRDQFAAVILSLTDVVCCAEARYVWLKGPDSGVICMLQLMDGHGAGEMVFRNGRSCTKRNAHGRCFTAGPEAQP
jgi:hypothetical protein